MVSVYGLVVLTLSLNIYIMLRYIGSMRNRTADRFSKYLLNNKMTVYDLEMSKPLSERIVYPLRNKLSATLARLYPRKRQQVLSTGLARAGLKLSPQEFVFIHLCCIILPPLAAALLMYMSGSDADNMILIPTLLAAAGYIMPRYWLSTRINSRRQAALKELPGIIDLLTVSMESGLSFDMSVVKLVSKSTGVLIPDFEVAINKMKHGISRRDALKDMADRLGIDEFTNFVGSVLQAERLGISISKILKVQAAQMRENRRQWAKERGGKAAVKIFIPLVLFIFPVIFIVLLGPSIMNIRTLFK
jgi:tight adherence protein C